MRIRDANQVIGEIKTIDQGYRALATAIILQACADYVTAMMHDEYLRIESIERFMLSDRFLMFSQGVDGSYILRKLKEKAPMYEEMKSARPVRCYDAFGNFVQEYSSLGEAERATGHKRQTIRRCIAAGRHLGGYYWEFVK